MSLRDGCPGELILGKEDGAEGTSLPSLETLGYGKEAAVGLRVPHTAPAGTGSILFSISS